MGLYVAVYGIVTDFKEYPKLHNLASDDREVGVVVFASFSSKNYFCAYCAWISFFPIEEIIDFYF